MVKVIVEAAVGFGDFGGEFGLCREVPNMLKKMILEVFDEIWWGDYGEFCDFLDKGFV